MSLHLVADPDSVVSAITNRLSCRAFQRDQTVDRRDVEDILDVATATTKP